MYKLNSIKENEIINNLISGFNRSPNQLYNPHESDSEILKINEKILLAVTTDSISEEIATGLYDDPYLIGWMIVTINISDLATVGASPFGILISEILPKNFSEDKIKELQKGISEACNYHRTFVLGGDTNYGENLILTGTAIGIINHNRHLTRVGCKPGNIVYSSGKLGIGNTYAISKLIFDNTKFSCYKPAARTDYIEIINKYASSSMDTSDGLISTLDQLMRLNETGFELTADLQNAIDVDSLNYSTSLNIPGWILLAGQHGEFELIFTVPQELKLSFLEEAAAKSLAPIELGKAIPEKRILLNIYDKQTAIDTTMIRNLPFEANGDVNHYLKLLLEYDYKLRNEPHLNFTSH